MGAVSEPVDGHLSVTLLTDIVKGAGRDGGGTRSRHCRQRWLDQGHVVYVHCRAGWQRSATVATAIVALRDGVTLDEALARIRRRRPQAQPLAHQLADLDRWWRARSVPGGA